MEPMSTRPFLSRSVRIAIAVLLLAVAATGSATAHVESSVGYSRIHAEHGEIRYRLDLEYDYLARAVGLGPDALNAADDRARGDALGAGRDVVEEYIGEQVVIFLDGAGCDAGLEHTYVEQRDGTPYAVLDLTYDCHGSPTGVYRMDYSVFSGAGTDAVVDDHTNIVDYELGGEQGRVVLDAGHRSFTTGEQSVTSSIARFVGLGFEHILGGLDHVLFVAALLLGAASAPSASRGASGGTMAAVAKVASMFTLAHSVTLGLGVLGWVHVPAEIVEPLIALSIAYVAVENLLGGPSRHRLAVVFAFGLLHGLGFAGALRFDDDLSWSLVTSLIGFNTGIELGQALLVVVLYPLLLAGRRLRWFPSIHLTATAAVAVMGLTWFVQRVI